MQNVMGEEPLDPTLVDFDANCILIRERRTEARGKKVGKEPVDRTKQNLKQEGAVSLRNSGTVLFHR